MRRDKELLHLFEEEKIICPTDVSSKIDATLIDLRKSNENRKNYRTVLFIRAAAALCVILFFALPNINSTIAYAMQEIPIIGELVKVITIRQYENDDEFHPQKVEIPEISEDGEAFDFINADIEELTDRALFLFKEECELFPDSHTGMIIDYEVVTNTKEWFTLKLLIHHEAGSSTTEYRYYHIDKMTGNRVTLSSLFKDDFDYVNAISENVLAQMKKRNEQLGSTVYWTDSEDVPEWNFSRIDAEQNFYFDENGNLTLVFDKYQIAPGYMGSPEFTIPDEVYKHALK